MRSRRIFPWFLVFFTRKMQGSKYRFPPTGEPLLHFLRWERFSGSEKCSLAQSGKNRPNERFAVASSAFAYASHTHQTTVTAEDGFFSMLHHRCVEASKALLAGWLHGRSLVSPFARSHSERCRCVCSVDWCTRRTTFSTSSPWCQMDHQTPFPKVVPLAPANDRLKPCRTMFVTEADEVPWKSHFISKVWRVSPCDK